MFRKQLFITMFILVLFSTSGWCRDVEKEKKQIDYVNQFKRGERIRIYISNAEREAYIYKVKPEFLNSSPKVLVKNGEQVWQFHKGIDRYNRKNDEDIYFKPEDGGYYLLKKVADDGPDYELFNISNLGMTAKIDYEKLVLFFQNFETGKPLAAKIKITDVSTGKYLETAASAKGLRIIPLSSLSGYKKGNTLLVQGHFNDNHTYVLLSGFDIEEYRTYYFTDKPAYRPKQKVLIKGMLRQEKYGKLRIPKKRKETLFILRLFQIIKQIDVELDEFGCFSTELLLDEDFPPGLYFISDKHSFFTPGICIFIVDYYRKPDFKVNVKPEKLFYNQNDPVKVNVEASYYNGEPVCEADFTYTFSKKEKTQYPDSWSILSLLYYYYPDSYSVKTGKGKTDENGKAAFYLKAPVYNSYYEYNVKVDVVDVAHRAVSGTGSIKVLSEASSLKAAMDKKLYKPNEKAVIKAQLFDNRGNPLKSKVSIKLLRIMQKTHRNEKTKEILSKVLLSDDNGRVNFEYKLTESGYYKYVLKTIDGSEEVQKYFICSKDEDNIPALSFGAPNIFPDRDSYKAGDKAEFLITIPFPSASSLITIESDRVLFQKVLHFKGNCRIIRLPLKKESTPNITVSSTFICNKKYYDEEKNFKVNDNQNKLKVNITTNGKTFEPRQRMKIIIKTLDDDGKPVSAQTTLSVVDKSIYGIYKDMTDNITDIFNSERFNQILTYFSKGLDREFRYKFQRGDWYYDVIAYSPRWDDFEKPAFIREFFPETLYFNPNLVTDQKGEAVVEITLPDSLTTWKIMARSITKDSKTGQNSDEITVNRNVSVRLIHPRFLTSGDKTVISGIVRNSLKKGKWVQMNLKAEGASISGSNQQKGFLLAGETKTFYWQIKAGKPGTMKLTLSGLTDTESDAMTVKIPVDYHSTRKHIGFSDYTGDKDSKIIKLPEKTDLNSIQCRLRLSRAIIGELLPSLDYLINYKYGCSEQTASRILAAVAANKILKRMKTPKEFDSVKSESVINRGLTRLYRLQNKDKGWGWWKNSKSDPKLTSYIVYCLSRVKKHGFKVKKDSLKGGKEWLVSHYEMQEDKNIKAYMLFALSEAGYLNKVWAGELYNKRYSMNNYALALSIIFLYNHHLNDEARDVTTSLKYNAKADGSILFWEGRPGGYRWMDGTDETTAIAVMALTTVEPESKIIGKAIRYLLVKRKYDKWNSTKDTAMIVTAILEYVNSSKESKEGIIPHIRVNGNKIELNNDEINKGGEEIQISSELFKIGKNVLEFEKTGEGRLYYSCSIAYNSDKEDVTANNKGLEVEREYFLVKPGFPKKGESHLIPLKENRIRINVEDIIRVRLKVKNHKFYEFLCIEDPKPAGCEYLKDDKSSYHNSLTSENGIKADDKIVFFRQYFYQSDTVIEYDLRAETPGIYQVKPSKTEMMYFPEISSIGEYRIIEITDREKKM